MKGLLVKDLKLFGKQKRLFTMVILIYAILIITKSEPIFLVSYLTMMFLFFSISTISYDEFDNGMLFLFTLPIDRRLYVKEKYLFGLLSGGVPWALSVIFVFLWQILSNSTQNYTELFVGCVSVLPVLYILWSVLLPLQLKFGSEKSRIVLVGAVGGVLIIGYFLKFIVNKLNIDIEALFNLLFEQDFLITIIGGIIITALFIYLSYAISVAIMQNKKF